MKYFLDMISIFIFLNETFMCIEVKRAEDIFKMLTLFLNFNLQREREKKKTFFVFMLFKHSITLSVCLSYLHFYVYFPSYQNIGGNWFRKRKYKFCSVWPDLTKFRHFGKSWQIFGKFLTVYFLPGKLLSPPWQIYVIFGLNFIAANGQILKNNLTIWSHWWKLPTTVLHLYADLPILVLGEILFSNIDP